jgi:hypothetical protein
MTAGRFARVPVRVAAMDLGSRALRVFIAIASHADQYGRAWPSLHRLAEITCIDRRGLSKEITKLKAAEVVRVEHRRARAGHASSNIYTVVFNDEVVSSQETTRVAPADDTVSSQETTRVVPGDGRRESRTDLSTDQLKRGKETRAGDLGRSAPSASTLRPTAEQIAEVDDLLAPLTGTPAIRDPAAYEKGKEQKIFQAWLVNLNLFVGESLDGKARTEAWAAISAAQDAGTRDAMAPAVRKSIDQLDKLYRAPQLAATGARRPTRLSNGGHRTARAAARGGADG